MTNFTSKTETLLLQSYSKITMAISFINFNKENVLLKKFGIQIYNFAAVNSVRENEKRFSLYCQGVQFISSFLGQLVNLISS